MQDKPDTQMEYVYKCRLCGNQFSPVQATLDGVEAFSLFNQLQTIPAIYRNGDIIRKVDYHHCLGDNAIGLADLIGVREVLK